MSAPGCPFCGEPEAEIDDIGVGVFALICNDCGAIGPAAKSQVEAVALWERRGAADRNQRKGILPMTLREQLEAALNRVTKWRSVLAGWQLGTRSIEDAEARAVRDHREITMLMRAELNAMLQMMLAKEIFTDDEWMQTLLDEVERMDRDFEHRFPGFKATHYGMDIDVQIARETMKGWPP